VWDDEDAGNAARPAMAIASFVPEKCGGLKRYYHLWTGRGIDSLNESMKVTEMKAEQSDIRIKGLKAEQSGSLFDAFL